MLFIVRFSLFLVFCLCVCCFYFFFFFFFFLFFLFFFFFFFFSSRRRHTRCGRDWSSDVCSSDLYLRDPDYFVKKKERDALALQDYLRSVTRFEQGLYYPVILKADMVIADEPNNLYRKEYFLLKAMAMGQINSDKTSLLPVLEQAIAEYPETEVAERSQELIDLINNGVPVFEEFTEIETGLFGYESKEYYVVVLIKEDQNANSIGNNVSNFNRE